MSITEYICLKCGRQLNYDIDSDSYNCLACGSNFNQAELDNPDFVPDKIIHDPKAADEFKVRKYTRKPDRKIQTIKVKQENTMATKGKCVDCGRENITIVAKGLCWKCYDAGRKGNKVKRKYNRHDQKTQSSTTKSFSDTSKFCFYFPTYEEVQHLVERTGFNQSGVPWFIGEQMPEGYDVLPVKLLIKK